MALDKSAVATAPAAGPVTSTPDAAVPVEKIRTMSAEERKVRGQVRMHAIIAGYKVGGMLAATLGTSPNTIREELHKLAAEVADKIEGYSFSE